MRTLRQDKSGRAALVALIAIVIAIAVVAVAVGALFAQRIPSANTPTDEFGNTAIGYVDITATIPINWKDSSCTASQCEVFMGSFVPKFAEHLTDPAGDVTEPAQLGLTLSLSCTVSVFLEVRAPSGLVIAEQESVKRSVVIGNTGSYAWGHVFVFEDGFHEAFFTLWAYGGDGCTDYNSGATPVKLASSQTSAGFHFDGVST